MVYGETIGIATTRIPRRCVVLFSTQFLESKIMTNVTNDDVIERIMRMGIEARHDSSFQYLEKLAHRQLSGKVSGVDPLDYSTYSKSIHDYISHMEQIGKVPYAFLRIDGSIMVAMLGGQSHSFYEWLGFVDSKLFPTVVTKGISA